MPSAEFDLAELPEQVRPIAAEISELSRHVITASLPRLGGPGPVRDLLSMRCATFDWTFYLARTSKKVVFFFFGRGEKREVVLDAKLSLTIRASPTPPAPVSASELEYVWSPPSYLLATPTLEQLRRYARVGGSPGDWAVLILDEAAELVLAIEEPHQKPNPGRIRLTQAGQDQPVERVGSMWTAEPFVRLFEQIRAWITNGREWRAERPLLFAARTDVLRILKRIAEAYAVSTQALADAESSANGIVARALRSRYEVAGFESSVLLRLKRDGSLARQSGDDPFQLRLEIQALRQNGRPRIRLDVRPPDFLATGDIHEAFFEAVRELGPADLAEKLELPPDYVAARLDAPAGSASVFRVKREQPARKGEPAKDTDIFVIHDAGDRLDRFIIFRVECRVFTDERPPRVEIEKNSLRTLYDRQQQRLHQDAVAYLLRLVSHLQSWTGVLR